MTGERVVAPERFIGTTGRPVPGPELDAVLEIAATCCVCGYWQRKEWLDGEGMCESCREAEEEDA